MLQDSAQEVSLCGNCESRLRYFIQSSSQDPKFGGSGFQVSMSSTWSIRILPVQARIPSNKCAGLRLDILALAMLA